VALACEIEREQGLHLGGENRFHTQPSPERRVPFSIYTRSHRVLNCFRLLYFEIGLRSLGTIRTLLGADSLPFFERQQGCMIRRGTSLPTLKAFEMESSNTTFVGGSSPMDATGWTPYIVALFAFYAVLCSFLRYQRRDSMQRQLGFPDRKPLSQMTTVEAQSITAYLAELEFPKIWYTSIQFALFKVRTESHQGR
jgi:hypothetical protein